jgi:hypothetical protein
MRDFKRIERKFEPSNPFTFCQKDTLITTEQEHALLAMPRIPQRAKSSSDLLRKNAMALERLTKNPKIDHRIGQFRKLKGALNEKDGVHDVDRETA